MDHFYEALALVSQEQGVHGGECYFLVLAEAATIVKVADMGEPYSCQSRLGHILVMQVLELSFKTHQDGSSDPRHIGIEIADHCKIFAA